MQPQRILISGAGIAGLTLAYWLHRRGFQPVVIDVSPHLRDEGYMIDFMGTGWDVAERMDLIPDLKRRQHTLHTLIMIRSDGNAAAHLNVETLRESVEGRYLGLLRQDLEAALYDTIKEDVEIRFGASIRRLQQHTEAVAVTFDDGAEETFDLVVGADGVHSNVRHLVWGDDPAFLDYLGYYVAAFPATGIETEEEAYTLYLEAGRQAGVYRVPGAEPTALLVYAASDQGYIPPADRKTVLTSHYEGAGWIVPQLIDTITDETPVYMDVVSQVVLPEWSRGRVVLVGDAAHCLTLISGQGASAAMGGAYALAEKLAAATEYRQAFTEYERQIRPFIEEKRRKARRFAHTFVPANRFRIWLMHVSMRLLLTRFTSRWLGKQIGLESFLPTASSEDLQTP